MKSCLAFILLLGCSLLTASAQGLGTVQRTFHTFRGDRTYTCLLIDGGAVPLTPSGTAKVSAGDGVSVNWPEDGAAAIIRPGSSGEAALLNLMGKPEAALAWKKYIVATLRDPGYTYLVHDFQPDVLDVNHWRIGAITMDYSIGGRKSSSEANIATNTATTSCM